MKLSGLLRAHRISGIAANDDARRFGDASWIKRLPTTPAKALLRDTKTPDEPVNADIDQLHRIRQLCYQSAKAMAILNEVKTAVTREMTTIRDEAGQVGTQR
jgi:hypothetical protein